MGPDDRAALAARYREAGRYTDAMDQARGALAEAPWHIAALTTLGWAAVAAEEPLVGEDAARRLLAAGAPGVGPLLLLALALSQQKRTVEAIGAADAAIAHAPNSAESHRIRSIVVLPRDPRGALASANLAVHLEPESAQSHLAAARALIAMNNVRDARRALNRTLELDPTDAAATHLLAVVDGAQWRFRNSIAGLLRVGAMDAQRADGIRHTVQWMLRRAAVVLFAVLTLASIVVQVGGSQSTASSSSASAPASAPVSPTPQRPITTPAPNAGTPPDRDGGTTETMTSAGRIGAGIAVGGVLAVVGAVVLATPRASRRVLFRAVATDATSVLVIALIALWLGALVVAAAIARPEPLQAAVGVAVTALIVHRVVAVLRRAR